MTSKDNRRIEPRVLKGFRDYLPQATIPRTKMIRSLEQVFSAFGFVPIDTPALEYAEILLGKGSDETDKQLFRFQDQGGRDVAMRFDLTVPLARFVAMHINELGTPFRRYHIAPVWRAEKPQRGRYREFIQCDFDIIGTKSVLADAEIVMVITRSLSELGIRHQIRLNNRGILNGLLEHLGCREANVAVLRAIDKLEKLGEETVRAELQGAAALNTKTIDRLFEFLALSRSTSTNKNLLNELTSFFKGCETALLGVSALEQVVRAIAQCGIDEERCRIDLSIARGLDYYTGSVFETTMLDLPHFGSICSGGRYDNLASLYTSRELPGVGASIGLDRIMGAFEELGKLEGKSTTAKVIVTVLDAECEANSLAVADSLRKAGIPTEMYPETAKLGAQLKYAGQRGITFAVIAGEDEFAKGICSVKYLNSGTQQNDIPLSELVALIEKGDLV